MKRILIIYVLALLPVALLGQSTTTTATITDTPDGSVWAGGVYQIQFVPGSPPPCTWSGGTLTLQFNGTLGSSGAFSVSLPSNSSISCPGNQWAFTMCPYATTGCFTVNTTVTGASQSLTTLLSTAAASPRFPASPQAYGYTTAEVNSTPKPGWQFFNTTPSASPQCSQWTGSAWQSCGAGGPYLPLAGGTMTGQIVTDGLGSDVLVPAGGSITVTNDGVHPNLLSLPWNSTANPAPTNATGWEGYVGSSGTSGWFDLPSALPASSSVMVFAAGSSGHSVSSTTPVVGLITAGNTIEASGCSTGTHCVLAGISGFYWSDTSATTYWTLDAPIAGKQYCFGNYSGQTNILSITTASSVYIVYKGTNGTVTSGTIVSGGAAGDFVCMEGVDTTHYMVTGAGYGTWTNN